MRTNKPIPPEDPIRPHVFDGIQEYDKRLPNWWLYTLYITIVFWIGYWGYYEWLHMGPSSEQAVVAAMAKVESGKLAAAKVDDSSLWKMSQTAAIIEAGRTTYATNCAACHLASLRGKSETAVAIGPDLTDTVWIYGGKPTEVYDLISKGVLAKGMPTWGPVLGPKKIAEVTAYILSKHTEGEPIMLESAKAAAGQ